MTAVGPQGVSADSIRAALEHVLAAREYDWRVTPHRSLWDGIASLVARVVAELARLHDTAPHAYYALIGLMALVLVASLAHMGYLVWRALRPGRVGDAGAAGAAAPATPIADAAWHLDAARREGAAGRYPQALAHRFLALVLTLERERAVRFDPAKTPAEYAREARLDEAGRAGFAELVDHLYRHLFGGVACTPDAWRDFDRLADTVGRRVAPA